jgi:hypothetical protein
MIGFSQVELSSLRRVTKVLMFILFVVSALYPFGPIVYYFDFKEGERVIDLSFKPFIWFDSENKSNEYQYYCRIAESNNLGVDEPIDHGFTRRYCKK